MPSKLETHFIMDTSFCLRIPASSSSSSGTRTQSSYSIPSAAGARMMMYQQTQECTNIKPSLTTAPWTPNTQFWLSGLHQCTTVAPLKSSGTPAPVLTAELPTSLPAATQQVLSTQKSLELTSTMSGTDKSCSSTKSLFSTESKSFHSELLHTTKRTKRWNSSVAQAVLLKTSTSSQDPACVRWLKMELPFPQVS